MFKNSSPEIKMQQKHLRKNDIQKFEPKNVRLRAFTFPRWPALDDIFGYLCWEIFGYPNMVVLLVIQWKENMGDWFKWTALH